MRRKKKWLLFLPAVCCIAFILFSSAVVRAEEAVKIDANKKYKGMNASFAKGYMPSIKKNIMQLIVPFWTDAAIKQEGLLIGVSFEREENSPFYFKNYQKQVKSSKDGVYLYKCKIKLRKDRVNGQYPLRLQVFAQTAEEIIRQEFTIYIEITDGRPPAGEESYANEDSMAEAVLQDQKEEALAEKEEIIHQPRIIIAENGLSGADILAGEKIFWPLSAQNCSKDLAIENMKVTLSSENKDISFEKNSWYFPRTEAQKTIDLSQNITISPKALEESVPIQILFDYEDKKGNTYNTAETLYFTVSQKQQAELVNFSIPESFYESDTKAVTFQVLNTGLSMIYNARVKIEARGFFANETFLGNVEAGTSCEGEMQVFAGTLNMDEQEDISDEDMEKYGDVEGEVIFSYENEQGEITEQRQKFSSAIQKPQVVELKIEEEEPKTNQWWITITAMLILVLLLIILWLYVRMKYYQKMRREIYERT